MDYDDHDGEEDEEEEEENEEEPNDIIHQSGTSSYDQQTPPGRKGPNSSKVIGTGGEPPSGFGNPKSSGGGGVRYRECLKNHAVGIGGHAVDGCGEFMPAGEEGTLDALKCAACNCHRNFHRKEAADSSCSGGGLFGGFRSPGDPLRFDPQFSIPYYGAPVGGGYGLHPPHHVFQNRPSQPLALPSTSGCGGDEHEDFYNDHMMMMMTTTMGRGGGGGINPGSPSSKKRFRTKFTQEQKDRMLEFSEKLGWRIQKHDEAAVQQLCAEIGVKRQVLKVWMHNNKNTLGRVSDTIPPPYAAAPPAAAATARSEGGHGDTRKDSQCKMMS